MLKKIFSLTDKGYRQVLKGIGLMTLHHLSLMLPAILLLLLTSDMLGHYLGYASQSLSLFKYWGLALLLILVIYGVYQWTYKQTYISAYEESANTRMALAEKMRKLPLSYFGDKDLSDLTSTLMDDTTTVEHTLATDIAELFGGILASVIILVTLFFYDWRMSMSLFICLPVALGLMVLSKKVSHTANWKNRKAKLIVSDGLQEYLENMKLIQTSPQKEAYQKGLAKKIKKVVHTAMIYELVMGLFLSAAYNLLRVGIGLVIVTGSYLMTHGQLDLIGFLLFLFVAAQIYDPLTAVFFKSGEFFYALVSASRIREIEEYPSQTGRSDSDLKHFDIEFDRVSFAYQEDDVIKEVSFVAKQGEITALVGPSGCGKSTLSKLAARFWDVQKGQIKIDGQAIDTIDPEKLLSYFSIVFQDVVLFNDTLYNNLKIGKKDATREEIMTAARMAQCDGFISDLPEGYETLIGENGKTLSGGERQRLSIARAFLKDAPIILLDEATASLDPENESLIQEAIGKLIENKTVLIIAHRLRSIEACDKIVVLQDGQVVQEGKHEALMASEGLYKHLFDLQRESASWGV